MTPQELAQRTQGYRARIRDVFLAHAEHIHQRRRDENKSAGVLDGGIDWNRVVNPPPIGGGPAFVSTTGASAAGTVGTDRHTTYGRLRQDQPIVGISADLVTGSAPSGADLEFAIVRRRGGVDTEITDPMNRLIVPDGTDQGYVAAADLADADGQAGDRYYAVCTSGSGGAFQFDCHTDPTPRRVGA